MWAAAIGTGTIRGYIASRRREAASNATINRELQLLHRGLRLANESDPQLLSKVPKVKMLPEENARTGTLDHQSYMRLRDILPSHYRLLLVVGYYTGARLGEFLHVQWPEVDLRQDEILLKARTTKTGEPRSLPIYGEMKLWLDMARADHEVSGSSCMRLFEVEGKAMVFNWRTWRRFCQLAGVPGLLFHDLRRTALMNMIDAGVSEKEAMEISGHTTRKTFERYHIVSRVDRPKFGRKMEQYISGTLMGPQEPSVAPKLLN
jgi:integrase